MEGPGVREKRGAQHGGSRPLLDLPLFLRVLRTILHRVPLGILASATSDFRPLTFSFRFKRFVSSSERNVFPPLPETFRFLQRLQCFLQRFTFRSFRFLDPLVFISFQGAAAAAAGRGSPPPPRAGVESG